MEREMSTPRIMIVLQDIETDRRVRVRDEKVVLNGRRLVDRYCYRARRLRVVRIGNCVGEAVVSYKARRWCVCERTGVLRDSATVRRSMTHEREDTALIIRVDIIRKDERVNAILIARVDS